MNKEILAPAGGPDQLVAAVRSGADAVYLGYGSFNARRNAKNFSFEELCNAVDYCHVRGVKVHAALNTLVTEKELSLAQNDVIAVAKAGVDAVIVQDLGLARIVKATVDELEMHASTQLSVHNVSGVKELERLGFSRAVLARELSLKEIEEICNSTNIEIEAFIHGALCMSFSGCCYLSSILGQRSGNRGLCAQPCRLDFKTKERGYALSLKDMSHINYINELSKAGVCSFKIEGRMKRPEYVAASVTACRAAISGITPDLKTLQAVFSRSGFTDGYITGNRTADMFGHRSKEDVVAAEGVLKDLAASYKDELKRIAVDMNVSVIRDTPVFLSVSDGVNTVSATSEKPLVAINRATTREDIEKQLSKTGGTPYFVKNLTVSLDEGITVPLSSLNNLRRSSLESLSALRAKKAERKILPYEFCDNSKRGLENKLILRASEASQLEGITDRASVILPLEDITNDCFERFEFVIGEIPTLLFGADEEKISAVIEEKKALGLKALYCNNISAVNIASRHGLYAVGGHGLNVINSEALKAYSELGVKAQLVSFETGERNLNELKSRIPLGIYGYGHLPLMQMRACPLKKKGGCNDCKGDGEIVDRMNIRFPLKCNNKRFTTLYNSVPLYIGDKDISADFIVLYFTRESASRVNAVYNLFKNKRPPDFERTTGLYFKNLK